MRAKQLSPKQQRILGFMRDFVEEHSYPPSIRDILSGCGIAISVKSESEQSFSTPPCQIDSAGALRLQHHAGDLLDQHGFYDACIMGGGDRGMVCGAHGCFAEFMDRHYMNERQRDYFRQKLTSWREDILKEAKETLQHLQDENQNHPDLADRASSETDRAIELRARDRQRKLISKIDAALQRIEDNTYGYCEETGEPISLKRLEARPIATLSVEAQERHEKREKVYRDE